MYMIRDPADALGYATAGAHRSTQISVQAVTPVIGNQALTLFGAEDEMIMETQMC